MLASDDRTLDEPLVGRASRHAPAVSAVGGSVSIRKLMQPSIKIQMTGVKGTY
jgi:hypothetical protein